MIQGIGVDMVAIPRVAKVMEHPRFLKKILGEDEQREVETHSAQPSSIAARWAAKEAVGKALGTGLAGIGLREIQLLHHKSGAPYIQLNGRALEKAETQTPDGRWHVSLSHENDMAIAMVIWETT